MKDELREKLLKKSDEELRRMVGSSAYARWAQELAVEVLAERGHSVALPAPPPIEPKRRRWLQPLLFIAASLAAVGGFLAYEIDRRDSATAPVRQLAERLSAVAATLPPLAHGPTAESTQLTDTFGAACAGPMAKLAWPDILGFVTFEAGPPLRNEVERPSWKLVLAHTGRDPSVVDNRSLRPDLVEHYLDSRRDPADDAWEARLPTQERLESFRYVVISRAFNVVPPHITAVHAAGEEKVPSYIGEAQPMTVEGELGRATLDISLVALDTKSLICRGQIDNVGPTSFVAFAHSKDPRDAKRELPGAGNTALFAGIAFERAVDRAWLQSLCPTLPKACLPAD